MKWIKSFNESIKSYNKFGIQLTKFTDDDVCYLDDLFQDIAEVYNINKVNNIDMYNIDIDTEDIEDISNQYLIGCSRNIYIEIALFSNVDEVLEALEDNFIPMIKNMLDWYLPTSSSFSISNLTKYIPGLEPIDFTKINIVFAKN